MTKPNLRPDHNGTQRAQFESNKKKIYATQTVCGICGKIMSAIHKWQSDRNLGQGCLGGGDWEVLIS